MDGDPQHLDQLVDKVRGGDDAAFEQLVLLVEPELRACVASHVARAYQIDEAVQESLVTAFRKLDQYRGPQAFLPWLRAIARNHLRMEMRAARQVDHEDAIDAVVIERQLDRLEAEEDATQAEAELARLRGCLDELQPDLRKLVERHHLDGVPLATLAQRLKRSENWVAVRLFRIRQALLACMARGQHAG